MTTQNQSANLNVGKVRDAHGMRGELYIILFAGRADWISNIKSLRLTGMAPNKEGKHQSSSVELTIKSYKPHKKGIILKTNELSDRTGAEKLIGFLVEVPFDALISKKGETIFLAEIDGFEVVRGGAAIGRIVGFGSNGAQDLLKVETVNGVAEIPFVKDFVEKINWAEKKVEMNFPEGLLP